MTRSQRRITRRCLYVVCACVCASAEPVHAVGTSIWEISSYTDFLAGETTGLIVSSDGDLRLGPRRTRIEIPASAVWSMLRTADGRLYVGTGNDGVVYRINTRGDVTPIALEALAVTGLSEARGASREVYATTLPGGKLYRIDGAAASVAHDFGDDVQLWDVVTDARGTTYVATGPHGAVYAIPPGSTTAREILTTPDTHVVSLALAPDGSVYAGTSENGLVYKIEPGGTKTAVWYDFDEEEIVRLAVRAENTLIVAANAARMRAPDRPAAGRRQSNGGGGGGDQFESLLDMLTGAQQQDARKTQRKRRGRMHASVYALTPQRALDHLLEMSATYITDMALGDGDVTYLATGERGHVYELVGGTTLRLYTDFDEPQASAISTAGGIPVACASSNPAAVYVFGKGPRGIRTEGAGEPVAVEGGEYRSQVLDAKFPAQWGVAAWDTRGVGKVSLATRSGTTPTPDDTWSPWSPLRGASPADIASPPGRYLQLRVTWPAASTVIVDSLRAAHRITNQKAYLMSIEINGERAGSDERMDRRALMRRVLGGGQSNDDDDNGRNGGDDDGAWDEEPGLVPTASGPSATHVIRWRVVNPDGDALTYRVDYREDTQTVWRAVEGDGRRELTNTRYKWDTEGIADGVYRVRVTATDASDNPPGEAHTDVKISEPFIVDNRRPRITNIRWSGGKLTGSTRDELSHIARLEYAVDGGDWRFIYPDDGVFDERDEAFSVAINLTEPGPHILSIRATDAAGNTAVAHVQTE